MVDFFNVRFVRIVTAYTSHVLGPFSQVLKQDLFWRT